MGFFRLLLRPRWRLFFFGLVALGLQIALLLISPAQVPVVLYKLENQILYRCKRNQ